MEDAKALKLLSKKRLEETQEKIQNLPLDSLTLTKLDLLNNVKVLHYHEEYSLVCRLCKALLEENN